MAIRTIENYRDLLTRNSEAKVGFALAASAVYAARHGYITSDDHGSDEWRETARSLRSKYGESLTRDQVLLEMSETATDN